MRRYSAARRVVPRRIVGTTLDVTERRLFQEELGRSESALAEASELARLGAWWLDLEAPGDVNAKPLHWSDEVYRIFGYEPGEIAVTNELFFAHVPAEERPRIAEAVSRALAERQTYRLEHRIRRKDGEERIVCEHAHAYFDPSGRPVRLVGAVQDVTDRKRAEEALRLSEERLRLTQAAAQIASWEWIPSTGELVSSPEADALYGTEVGTLPRYENWLERIHPEDRARMTTERDAAIARGESFRLEFRILHTSGETRWITGRGKGVYDEDGNVVRVLGIDMDITEQRRVEQDLRRADELLLETDRRRTEFLAVLSHELRNPLAPIRNSLYILERLAEGGPQVQQALEVSDRQLRQLTRLVDHLLDVNRLAQGKIQLHREALDLGELVRRTVDDHREMLAAKGVELTVSVPGATITVDGDRTRLVQVIGNLLQNASKFTNPGGHVAVTLEGHGDARAAITVRDDGLGILPETLDRLFEPFMQAEQTLDRTGGGLGVGLSLVKAFVEMHGGRVRADSAGLGKGADFEVELPTTQSEGATTAVSPPTAPSRTPRRVLVVEDNRDSAESLMEALRLRGDVVDVALSGPEALAKAKAFIPDVVLCDIGLPGMDGYEVARRLRSEAGLCRARLVALTGYALDDDIEKSREAGFDFHMAKPPDFDLLEAVLNTAPGDGPRPPAPSLPSAE